MTMSFNITELKNQITRKIIVYDDRLTDLSQANVLIPLRSLCVRKEVGLVPLAWEDAIYVKNECH